jgi:hypothetical protein
MKKLACLSLAASAVLVTAACSSAKPPLRAAEPNQEIYIEPGPYQLCAAVSQLLHEAPEGFPSFRQHLLQYESAHYDGAEKYLYEAKPVPWADLTGCTVEILSYEEIAGQVTYNGYTCQGGTDWEDPDYLFRMMVSTLQVCFYGKYVFRESEHYSRKLVMREAGSNLDPASTLGILLIIEYFPKSKKSLYINVIKTTLVRR